jgi:hypothetical protein
MSSFFGPAIEAQVTTVHVVNACDLWEMLNLATLGTEIRVKVDWNGINARAWDQSFVPWCPPMNEGDDGEN